MVPCSARDLQPRPHRAVASSRTRERNGSGCQEVYGCGDIAPTPFSRFDAALQMGPHHTSALRCTGLLVDGAQKLVWLELYSYPIRSGQ